MRASARMVALALAVALAGGLSWWVLGSLSPGTLQAPALDASRPRPQGDFLIGAFPEPTHLNPLTNIDAAVRTWVLRLTYDALSDVDPRSGAVRPALAESITTASDGTLRIALRSDARFADGSPLTAADVVFTHRCARSQGLPMSAMVRAASMVEVLAEVGPHALVGRGLAAHWSARDVFATGLFVLSRANVLRLAAERARGKGQPAPAAEAPELGALLAGLEEAGPGSGPYQLVRGEDGALWPRGQHLELMQNPHSWRRRAFPTAWNLAGFRHVFVTDKAAQIARARQQQLDWLAGDVRALHGDGELQRHYRLLVYDPPSIGHFMVAWNCRREPLTDPRVRRALSALFDRRAISERLLHGDAVPAVTWFKPGMPEVPPDLAPVDHDPAAAAAALPTFGWGNEHKVLRVEILGAAEDPLHRRILELAQSSFAAAGVELVPQLVEGGVLRDRLQRRDFMGLLALKYHTDPWIDPWPHFHSSQAAAGGQNWMGFADDEVDRLLDSARAETDASRRVAIYQAFCRRVHALEPVTLLVHPRTAILLHTRFRDVEVGGGGLSPESWWVPVAEQIHRRPDRGQ